MPVLGDSISGNAGAAGVTMTLSGASSATTTSASDGTYTFGSLSAGSYVVTPSLTGVTFTPSNLNETIVATSITGVNFVAATTNFVRTQTVSDNFHRADSPNLGANWTPTTDANTPIAIVSDTAVSSTPAGYGVELYSGVSFPDDQFAAATIDAFGVISDISLFIRDDLTDATGYYITVSGDGSGNYFLDLFDNVASNDLYPEVSLSGAPQPGDLITIQVVGTLVTAFYNGVPVASGTSTTTTSGSSAFSVIQSATQTDTSLSLFSAGSVTQGSGSTSTGPARLPFQMYSISKQISTIC